MKTAQIFAAPAILSEVTAINARNIRIALADFVKHTDTHDVIEDISDAFIDRLAEDSAVAKSGLREMFRRVEGWNEGLQAVVINGTKTHDTDWVVVRDLLENITREYRNDMWNKADSTNEFAYAHDFCNALRVFQYPDGAETEHYLAALNKLAPHAYRKNRPLNRCFQEFCKVVGIYDSKASSNYQRLYARYADEMKSKKIDFKLFVSINPAHFLTMSNPIDDQRGKMLVSCHSLNRTDYHYSAGNAGYARDDVTFIVFTVDNPDNAELLNNRKTSRQLFMYKPNGGLLLQSRLYDTCGGTCGAQSESKLYRDLVQRTISEGEDAINMWKTSNYDKSGVNIPEGDGFQGYRDWLEFCGDTIKLSIRSDKADFYANSQNCYAPFTVGTYGLCVKCGGELSGDDKGHYCQNCDEEHEKCEECGEYFDTDEITWVIDQYGDEVPVCDDCLSVYYFYCDRCNEWHHVNDSTQLADGTYVCSNCLEYCHQCDMCEEWFADDDDLYVVYDGGEERFVCASCRRAYFTECPSCGEYHRDEDINRESGLCRQCHENQEDENE